MNREILLRAAAKVFQHGETELLSRRKFGDLVWGRWCMWYVARHGLGWSYPQIGFEFGMYDHTTVMYGIAKVQDEMNVASRKSESIDRLVDCIRRAG